MDFIERHWRWLAVLAWALIGGWMLFDKWPNIMGFVLSDTDDNMRMSQVRAWLNGGQDWYDLRQYKLNWPDGANMHWSRLVDLPLAGLMLLGRLFLTGPQAEQLAIAVAPLIPLLLLIVSVSLSVRRLVHPAAWPLAVACIVLRRIGQRAVPSDADRPSRLAARLARDGHRRDRRPQAGARRR